MISATPCRVQVVLALGLLALPVLALGQEPADVPEITLQEVLRSAQRDPPSVLVAHSEFRRAQAERSYASGAWIPALTSQASAGYNYDNSVVPPGFGRIDSQSLRAGGELNLAWTALDAARGEQIDAAQAFERARGHDVDTARARALVLAAELYLRAGAAIELTKDAELSLQRRREQFEATTGLVKAGTRSPVDAQRSKIEVLSAEYEASLRRTDELAAYAALAAALGRPADELLRPATTHAEFPVSATSPQRAKQLAAANRPELRSAAANVSALRHEYDAAIGARWPRLGVEANAAVSYLDVRSGVGIEGHQYGGTAGLILRWDGLDPAVWMKASASEAAAGVAGAEREQLAHAIGTEAVNAYYALERARTQHRRAIAVLEAAQVTREAQNGRYLAGLASLLELLDAEDLEQQARQQRIEAQRDESIVSAQLQSACGLLGR